MIQTDPYNSNNNPFGGPTFLESIRDYFFKIPLFTRCIFVVCVLIFLVQCIFDWPNVGTFCFQYQMISRYPISNIYRMFTYFVFHMNILHLAFNMMALMSLGYLLEVRLGTIPLIYATIYLAFLSAMLQFVLEFVLFDMIHLESYTASCGAGYSGILFAYTVLSVHYESMDRSLFGAFAVPAKFYPWILLLLTSLLFPGVSFTGHLCGILSGYVFIATVLYRNIYKKVVRRTEQMLPTKLINSRSFYISSITDIENQQQQQTSYSSPSILDSLRDAYYSLKERITGAPTYMPLATSPNEQDSRDSNTNDDYWHNAGQGRVLGSV